MNVQQIGIDLVDIRRFRAVVREKNEKFLRSVFSESERAYCLSYRDPAPHFAGVFAAKEAVRKTSSAYVVPLPTLEIRRDRSGKPSVWLNGKRTRVAVSITHTASAACAVALSA